MSVERAALNEARETFGEELVVPQDLAEKINEWRFTTEVLNQWESVGRQVLAIHEGLVSASRKSIKVDDPSQQLKPGYEQDPQHRRAHFKVVWTGEGSMVPKTVFIEPYWTHREKLGVSGVNTVRRVKLDP